MTQRGPCAIEMNPIPPIFTHYCTLKAALYSPSSYNAQRQKGRKLCCNILKHKSCYQPETASCFPYTWIWFTGGCTYRALCSVFQRVSALYLVARIYTSGHGLCKQTVCPVYQTLCTDVHWHSLLHSHSEVLFPKLGHATSFFLLLLFVLCLRS